MTITDDELESLANCFVMVCNRKMEELQKDGYVFKEDQAIAVMEGLRTVFKVIQLDKMIIVI